MVGNPQLPLISAVVTLSRKAVLAEGLQLGDETLTGEGREETQV